MFYIENARALTQVMSQFKNENLTETHKFTASIIKSMTTLLKGEVKFVENHNKWLVEVVVKWNKKRITTIINSRKLDLQSDFVFCALTQSPFISFITRSYAFNFNGVKSECSELLLESSATQCLMESKKGGLKLDGKYLIFSGGIKKEDETSLSNIFKLIEMLMLEIDGLYDKQVIYQKI